MLLRPPFLQYRLPYPKEETSLGESDVGWPGCLPSTLINSEASSNNV